MGALALFALVSEATPPGAILFWLELAALGALLIYFARMFLGGLLFNEQTKDMDLPPRVVWLAFGLILAGVGLVLLVFLK